MQMDLAHRRDMHGGGETVVGGLPHIHMVVRMHGLFAAAFSCQHLVGAARDHLATCAVCQAELTDVLQLDAAARA